MIEVKESADLSMIDPRMWVRIGDIHAVFARHGRACIITSGRDGRHGPHSHHYRGRALDFRTRHLSEAEKLKISSEIRARLEPEFDVVLEKTHLHVEFDPQQE